jgi:rare lipoprotein A
MKKLLPALKLLTIFLFCLSKYGVSFAQSTDKENKPTHTARRVLYGTASFYANKFNGRQTASGEIFSQDKLTCACNVLPFGTWIKVTNIKNGRFAIVKVNDRLHPKMRRIVDLTKATAISLGYKSQGIVKVKVEVLGKTKPQQQ